MSIPVALQLYSVRDELENDFAGTLFKVKEMGYDGVELSGLNGKDPKMVKSAVDQAGLFVMSSHVPFREMQTDPQKTVKDYKTAGCKYIVIPWMDTDRLPGGSSFTDMEKAIRETGRIAHENGLTLLYHNHDFEFKRVDGELILDLIYQSFPEEYLKTQIDTCWAKVGGVDPAEYIRKYKGRAPLVHIKDFVMENQTSGNLYELIGDDAVSRNTSAHGFDFRPVGYGQQDVLSILEASAYAGTEWVIVEQDNSSERPALEAAKMSIEYLRSLDFYK